jgi:hypothetical protein
MHTVTGETPNREKEKSACNPRMRYKRSVRAGHVTYYDALNIPAHSCNIPFVTAHNTFQFKMLSK